MVSGRTSQEDKVRTRRDRQACNTKSKMPMRRYLLCVTVTIALAEVEHVGLLGASGDVRDVAATEQLTAEEHTLVRVLQTLAREER